MKLFQVLFAIFMVTLAADAAPVSDPQQVVNVIRTTNESVAPLTQFRVVPVNNQQFSHLSHAPVQSVQTLRSVPFNNQQFSHLSHAPVQSVQTLRSVPSHIFHNLRTSPATHAVQSVRTVPTVVRSDATHVVHTAPTQTLQAVRTIPAQAVVHTDHVPVRTTIVAQPAEAVGVAQYSFGYSIADTETGDSKTRQETRNGDVTTGSYSVADPDGRIRTVTYTADAVNGFRATVTYDGEPGPPAIPINAPQTAQIVAQSSPTVINVGRGPTVVANSEPVVVAQRMSLFDNVNNADTTQVFQSAPQFNIQSVRTVPTVVRSDATHLVHTAPTHTVHAFPQTVRTITSPTASHVVHHSDHSTPTVLRSGSPNVLQFQTDAGIRSVPIIGLGNGQFQLGSNQFQLGSNQLQRGSNQIFQLGSNQFQLGNNQFLRAVNTVPSSATHLFHA